MTWMIQQYGPGNVVGAELLCSSPDAKEVQGPHVDSESSFYGARTFGKRTVLGYYYWSLIFADMTKESHKTKTFGEDVM